MKKPIVLVILDGFGIGEPKKKNAIFSAKTPNFNCLFANKTNILLQASGKYVGLPDNQIGNSEVGHMNLGAGRILYQSLTRVNNAIENNELKNNEELIKAFQHTEKNQTNLHFYGLLSDGGVHSHIKHLFALLKCSQNYQIQNIFVHGILDGRDTNYKSATKYIKETLEEITHYPNVHLATLSGRYYAMDRDKRWDRTLKAYQNMVFNQGDTFISPIDYVNASYQNGVTDEFVIPAHNPTFNSKIQNNDTVIAFNFRPDRMIQISSFLTNKEYYPKSRVVLHNLYAVQMMKFADSVKAHIAFKKTDVINSLSEVIANHNLKQFHIAETEKFAHVTYFFNGGKVDPFKNEERLLIPSPKVATYDLLPKMSALEITAALCDAISQKDYDFIVANYANPDMVGHTGDYDATICAIEIVDQCIGKLMEVVKKTNAGLLITADHGNAEDMFDDNNVPITAHTTSPVPLIFYNLNEFKFKENLQAAKLSDVAPSVLKIMDLEIPSEMKGNVLIDKKD